MDYLDDIFAVNLFREWQQNASRSSILSHEECAGFQVPMFLGGKVSVENLEVTSSQVHWSLTAQLWRSTGGLPPGTLVRDVGIE